MGPTNQATAFDVAERLHYSHTTMAKVYDLIDDSLASWIRQQPLFFTATAPGSGGHVNCSPKGWDTLRILDPRTVAYLDLIGSGAETVAHIRDNGRICLMFCAFQGAPRIVRIHGRGEVVQPGEDRFPTLLAHFEPLDETRSTASRSVIVIHADRIADSCGFGVPLMTYEGERPQMPAWVDNRLKRGGAGALAAYQVEKNLASIDGLPGLDPALPPLRAVHEEPEQQG
ncbi:MAG: pyridoxamine 5'-phosphate oxidase family protein [Chloroflexota bacterium]